MIEKDKTPTIYLIYTNKIFSNSGINKPKNFVVVPFALSEIVCMQIVFTEDEHALIFLKENVVLKSITLAEFLFALRRDYVLFQI